MNGGAEKKYPDAKPGDVITLSNGAQAEVQANGRFKIVKGANAAHMTAMRKNSGHTKGAKAVYNKISSRSAKMAFNRYYNWDKEQKRVRSGEKRRFKNERGLKQSRTYDLNHTGKRVVDDVRYRRNPRGFDYEGVDTGDKVRAPRSPKQKARDAALKAKLSGTKGRISKAKLEGGYYW